MSNQSGFADVNGTRLYYEVAGSGFPIVLIHGFGADSRVWDHQVEPFAKHYQVIRYDARGYGKSAVPTGESYTHPDDLEALLDCLNIQQAHIMGQSMGGEIAMEFALAYPAATRSLILVDSALGGYQWSQAYNESWIPIFTEAAQSGFKNAIDILMTHPLHVPISEKPEAASRLRAILNDYSAWHLTNRDTWRRPEPPAIQQLANITAPTLLMIPERGIPDFQQIAALLQRDIPNVRTVRIPGSGHVIPLEAPEQLNAVTLDFLADITFAKG
ncbi:MAG: alpha/beta hydrolase [Anaerolineae bacterium]|nr:alpha/beta hydrolase [Anaerolineae bacterium]